MLIIATRVIPMDRRLRLRNFRGCSTARRDLLPSQQTAGALLGGGGSGKSEDPNSRNECELLVWLLLGQN
ncbi:Protein of unknown function [Gryllus bimaculatus]|nr:Protein of unknown function [Gryllus bimaculatus]